MRKENCTHRSPCADGARQTGKRANAASEVGRYTPLVKVCVRASLDLQPPPITGRESLHVLETVFACYRAAESGRTQKVG